MAIYLPVSLGLGMASLAGSATAETRAGASSTAAFRRLRIVRGRQKRPR